MALKGLIETLERLGISPASDRLGNIQSDLAAIERNAVHGPPPALCHWFLCARCDESFERKRDEPSDGLCRNCREIRRLARLGEELPENINYG